MIFYGLQEKNIFFVTYNKFYVICGISYNFLIYFNLILFNKP